MRRTADEQSDDEQVYSTPEGDVLVQIVDSGVFVAEGFDLALARQLSAAVIAAQARGPLQQAKANGAAAGELGLGLVKSLSVLGVPRAALQAGAMQ